MRTNSLVLVEGNNADLESLPHLSLGNAKATMVGIVRHEDSVILNVTSSSPADLRNVLLKYTQVSGVTEVMPLKIWTHE